MPDQTIKCPKCGTQIPLTEALTGQIEQSIKLRYEAEAAEKAKDLDKERMILKQKGKELEAKGKAINEQVAEQLKAERKEIAEAERKKAVAEQSDVVFSIVGFPEDVRQVYLGENSILDGAADGAIVVDMTTTEPTLAQEIAVAAARKNVMAIDALVSGGDIGAINAALSIMVGGDKGAADVVMPLFEIMGKSIGYQGPAGAGQHTKMCNQITLSGTLTGVAQALIYGHQAGLDLDNLIGSISKGAAGCWVLDHLAPKMAVHDFDPGFYVEHFLKDLGIALKEAERMNLQLPGLEQAIGLYNKVVELGHGRSSYHALLVALEDLSKVDISE